MSDQRPDARELVEAVREFLEREVQPRLEGSTAFHARVAVNVLAIVEFDVDGESVRAIGQVGSEDDDELFEVESGDEVEPVYVEELREPGVGLKPEDADQEWDGYRFEPTQ